MGKSPTPGKKKTKSQKAHTKRKLKEKGGEKRNKGQE